MMLTGKRPKEAFAGLQMFHGLPLRDGYTDLWQLASQKAFPALLLRYSLCSSPALGQENTAKHSPTEEECCEGVTCPCSLCSAR